MRFKDYLEDFMEANRDFTLENDELWCSDLKCTEDIGDLLEDDQEMSKTEFANRLCKEIVDMYVCDLEWYLGEITDEDDIETVEHMAHDIIGVLRAVKSY